MCISKRKIFFLWIVFATAVCTDGCNGSNNANTVDDPTTIYSIIREDTSAGIDIVGLSRSNPMEVRKQIFESQIPEISFEEKRKTFYAILDTLYRLKTYEDEDSYADVDSFNYLAIHYLKNILRDKKSCTYPLKHKMLSRTISPDRNFSVYCWEENIGVDIPTMLSVYQYIAADGTIHSFFNMDNEDSEDFNFSTSKIIGIYRLSFTKEKSLYLLNFEGCTDNENCFKGSTIVEIAENKLKFDYNSFGEKVKYFFETYAKGEKLTLSYNAATKVLMYRWFMPNNKPEQKVFLFNGEMFQTKE